MIHIVSRRIDAPFTEFCVEMRVFQSEHAVFGFIMPYLGDYGGTEAQAAAELGEPVADAFASALQACRTEGWRYLFINDPGNLFPPAAWPTGNTLPEWEAVNPLR